MPPSASTRRGGAACRSASTESRSKAPTRSRTRSQQSSQRRVITIASDSESEPSSESTLAASPGPPPAAASRPVQYINSDDSQEESRASAGGRNLPNPKANKRPRPIDLTRDDPVDMMPAQNSKGNRKEPVASTSKRLKSASLVKPTPQLDFEDDFTCPICYEIFLAPMNLQCGHVFCDGCLAEWLEKTKECPTCREVTKREPSRALLLETMADKFVKNQAAQMGSNGDSQGGKALLVTRSQRTRAIETARIARAKKRQEAQQAVRQRVPAAPRVVPSRLTILDDD